MQTYYMNKAVREKQTLDSEGEARIRKTDSQTSLVFVPEEAHTVLLTLFAGAGW